MNRIAIVSKPNKEELARILPPLVEWLNDHGYEPILDREGGTFCKGVAVTDRTELPLYNPKLIIVLGGDGKQTRSFCYVSDLIDGIYKLSQSNEHLPVNIGNPVEMTILEFAERVRTHFENAPAIIFEPLPQDDPKRRRPDISKAKRVLNWEPKVDLAEGLKRTLAYFKEEYAAKV